MTKISLLSALAIVLALSVPAWALECPVLTPDEDPAVVAAFAEFLPQDFDLGAPNAIESAVFALKNAGIADDLIVDNLIAVYCGSVAGFTEVPDAEKTQRIEAFSQTASEAVFGDVD